MFLDSWDSTSSPYIAYESFCEHIYIQSQPHHLSEYDDDDYFFFPLVLITYTLVFFSPSSPSPCSFLLQLLHLIFFLPRCSDYVFHRLFFYTYIAFFPPAHATLFSPFNILFFLHSSFSSPPSVSSIVFTPLAFRLSLSHPSHPYINHHLPFDTHSPFQPTIYACYDAT